MQNENDTASVRPTESQIKVLMSDWLGNLRQKDEGNYTHKGRGGIRRKSGEGIADYLLGDTTSKDTLELMKAGRHAARNIVSAVVNGPADVEVGGQMSYHNEDRGQHVIRIASDYFDDASLSNKEKVGVMLGLAAHEAAHGVYTDNEMSRMEIDSDKSRLAGLRKEVWNLLEDERIEYLLGEDRPGCADVLGETKGYYFKKLQRKLNADGKRPTEPIPKLLSALQQAVRYPSELSREDVEENFEEMDAFRKALTPYPLTSEGCWRAADKVMEIIRKKAEEEMQKQQQQQQQSQGQQGSGGGGGQKDQQQQQNQRDNQQNQTPSGDKDNKNTEDDSGKQKKPTKKEIDEAIEKALNTEEGRKVMDAIRQDNDKGNAENQSREIQNSEKSQIVNDDRSETAGGAGTGNPKTFVLIPKGDKNAYNRSLNRVRAFIPAMTKALACKTQDKDYCLRGMPSGRLNTNRFASLVAGNTNIFSKKGSVRASSASVCLLIDESGSMSSKKTEAARDAAILVKEAVDRIPKVNYFCYGYTSELIHVFAERGREGRWALGGSDAIGGTPTGDAMSIVSKRVRKLTADPVLLLVLTDGAADYSEKVIKQDNLLRGQGFIPVGVGILTSAVTNTFKDCVVINDMSSFARDLGHLVRGRLDRMIVRRDTIG